MESALAATVASQRTVLCIVFGLFLTTTVIEAQQFTIEPESVVQAEGLLAEFKCLSPEAISHLWFVNGIPSTSLTSDIRVVEGSEGCPSVLTIPSISQFNNSVLQCGAIVSVVSGRVFSRNATLKVERVSVDVLNDKSNITVSVINNFTLKNLTYRVDISNEMITLTPLNGRQSQVQFTYEQTNNHTVCDIFFFTVTPISESGMEGRSSEPVTGFFTTVTDNNNVSPLISQGGNVSSKIVHLGGMVPNCTNFTSYQVTFDILAPINKTIEDPQMINFSLPTDQIINISVTLISITSVRLMFQNIPIRTTDVQDLMVNIYPQKNCVSVSITYVEGTLSPGALVCVIRLLSDDSLDFTSMKLVPIPRNMSENFTIPVARGGKYIVISFDLENNSIPRMPISIVADSENMFLINGSSNEPTSPLNAEGITVTKLPNGSAEVTCTTTGQSCLALFPSTNSPTSLDSIVVGFIEPPNDRTTVTLNATSDVYVVVYTWNSDSGETIFDGKVSFVSQLELPTSPLPTQSPPDNTRSPSPIVIIIIVVVVVLVISCITIIIVYLVKRYRRDRKVLYSHQFERHSQYGSLSNLDVGASITSQEEVIPLYDAAHPENMSLECNTADTDATPPPGYDVVCKENMQVEYETVPLVLASKPTITSENPPPLPLPMIQGDSEAPDLPPPYNPAVDSESVVVMSVESSISQSGENQSVDEVVDESLKKDLSVSDTEHDDTTEEDPSSTKTQESDGVDTQMDESVHRGAEDGASNSADCGGQEAMIATQLVEHKPIDKVIMKDSSKVGYSKVDNDKLKPVVPPPALLPRQRPLLPTHEMLMDLLRNVDNKWEDIAKALKFDEDRVNKIFTNNKNEYLRLYELMEYYFMNVHCSHSWEEMVRVLTEIGEHGLAGRIKAEKIQDQDAHDADSYLKAVEANNCDESTQASVQGNESKAEPPTQDKKDTVEANNCDESTQASVQGNESKAEPPTQDKKDTVETNNCDESTQASVQGNESKAEPPTQDKKDTVETNNCDESTQASVQGNESKAEPPTQDKKDTVETNNCDESTQASVRGNESKAEPPTQDKKDTVESNNCDESTQASVRGNESKVVPPTQNDLSHPQVVDPLPIDKSNQSSVKEGNDENQSENDKNQLNVTKLGDNQRGGDRSMTIPPQPNYVTPSLLQDAVITVV